MRAFSPSVVVFIDGVLVEDQRIEVHTNHGLELPVATCTVVLSVPRPAAAVFNKVVEVFAQIAANPSRIFHGVIRADADSLDAQGFTATLNCQGWGYILAMPATEDRAWSGPRAARNIIRSILHTYGFGLTGGPPFHCPIIVNYDGTEVMLGGNAEVDDGQVRWEKGESGLSLITRICTLFGYHACDTPAGVFYIIRAIGQPSEPARHLWDEGEDLVTLVRSRDAGPIANWIEVTGATPIPADGTTTGEPYRSFPASVPVNDLIPEPGAKFLGISDDLLVSDDLCESVRTIAEVRYNSEEPATMYEWTDIGHPRFRQGRVMALLSPTLGVDVDVWLYSMQQDITADGYWETFTGRADNGIPLPEGDEVCFDLPIIEGVTHLGDETLAYYDNDAPDGTSAYGEFNPGDEVTSMTLVYEGHGVNSYLIGGQNTGSNVSRYILEQPVGTEIAAGTLPQMDENYGEPPTWEEVEIPIPGTLAAGTTARLTIESGTDDSAVLGPTDDFEIRNMILTICSEGTPDLPETPTNPPIPPPTPVPPVTDCVMSPPDVTVGPTISYGPLTVPAGTSWVWVHGNVTGATGLYSLIGSYSAQGYVFYGAGLSRFMVVPGTASEFSGAILNGTAIVGAGPFETFYRISTLGLVSDYTIHEVYVRSVPDSTAATVPITLTDVCVEFLGPTEWPYP